MRSSRGQLRLPRTARTRRPASTAPRSDPWQRGTSIVGILSVLLVGLGLILTNDFNRDQLALQQKTAQEQQDLALKGQRADRFVRAVDQLGQEGNDKLGVRLGGVYALEALMKEFPADENMVIEVLCAFVRSHAPYKAKVPISTATPDVRAVMTVLGRRPDPDAHIALDFSYTMLGLYRFNLPGASFRGVDLSVASFSEAKLTRADLRNTDLTNSYFDQADLRGANMAGVILHGTELQGAILAGANLRDVNFTDAILTGADLTGADLSGTATKGLTTAQLACAKVDAATRLPAGVVAPAPGAWQQEKCAVDAD
jgi:pentapeptide repeat protein